MNYPSPVLNSQEEGDSFFMNIHECPSALEIADGFGYFCETQITQSDEGIYSRKQGSVL